MNHLYCASCLKTYDCESKIWRCPCGGLLNLSWESSFPKQLIAERKPTMWRYREALPLESDTNIVSFQEGFTPILPVIIDKHTVMLKQDYLFPSASYKDRGASVLISKVKELGIKRVVEDSSGNAGCAIAAYCALADIGCEIYVPASVSRAKLVQLHAYRAIVHRIPGTREDTAKAISVAAQTTYYASHSWNPYFFHGTKTVAYEICEQLGWISPDVVVVPAGNGTLVLGVSLGFNDLYAAGIVQSKPKIIAVQTAACAPLYRAFITSADTIAPCDSRPSIAEGIAIAAPVRARQILESVAQSRGEFVVVTEEEIIAAFRLLAGKGFYVEPTAAATIAGLRIFLRERPDSGIVVSILTGHGLKSSYR